MPALVFFCHGSRSARWREPFDALVDEQRRRAPALRVELAFLECMAPTLPQRIDQLVAEGIRQVRIVPLFLAPGTHTERDLPDLVAQIQQRWPTLQITVAPVLLDCAAVRSAILAALETPGSEAQPE